MKFSWDLKIDKIICKENDKREDIIHKFVESLTDFLSLLAAIMITITGFRTLYFIAILSVNGHLTYYNQYLKRVSNSTLLLVKLQQIEAILQDPKRLKAKK